MADESQKIELPKGKQIGKITHYFSKIGVAVLALEGGLKAGDTIVISGQGREFEQLADSMQVDHENVQAAKAGDEVGLKVAAPVKEGCLVYLKE